MLKSLVFAFLLLRFADFAHAQVVRDGSKQQQAAKACDAQTQTLSQPCLCSVKVENSTAKRAENTERKPYQWHELIAPANIPNWFLAGLAGWAGLMALHTLRAIRKQADLMKKQADAMDSQNRDARNRERAKLVIRDFEVPEIYPIGFSGNSDRAVKVRVIVENVGGSRAFNVRAWGVTNISSDRQGEHYDVGIRKPFPPIIDADLQKHFLTVTGFKGQLDGIATTGDYDAIPEELAREIRDGEAFIVASGTILYDDLFDDTYEVPFHFVWRSWGNDDGGRWLTDSSWLIRSPEPRRVRRHEDQKEN